MRYAVILGIVLVTLILYIRAPTADPWPDVASYEMVGLLENSEREAPSAGLEITRIIFGLAPPQLILVILATIALFAASILRPSEPFIVILAASPAFLITFTQLGITPITITLTLIAAALLVRGHTWAIISIPFCVALDAASGILAGIVLVAISLRQSKYFLALSVSLTTIVSCMLAITLDPGFGLTPLTPFAFIRAEALGIAGGATVLTVFLAIIGFVLAYRTSQNRTLLALLPLIPLVMILEHGAVIATTILAFYAANAWEYFAGRQWSFTELRDITLIILVCSVLFTAAITVRERATPNEERIEFMRFAHSGFPAGSNVLADDASEGILLREGIVVSEANVPADPSFIASSLQNRNIQYVVTRQPNPNYDHFQKVYSNHFTKGYAVYEVPYVNN